MSDEDDTNPLPFRKDPMRYAWAAWLIIVLALIAVPVSCTVLAAEPAGERAAYCSQGWCFVKQEELTAILAGVQQMSGHIQELRKLCGWEK